MLQCDLFCGLWFLSGKLLLMGSPQAAVDNCSGTPPPSMTLLFSLVFLILSFPSSTLYLVFFAFLEHVFAEVAQAPLMGSALASNEYISGPGSILHREAPGLFPQMPHLQTLLLTKSHYLTSNMPLYSHTYFPTFVPFQIILMSFLPCFWFLP